MKHLQTRSNFAVCFFIFLSLGCIQANDRQQVTLERNSSECFLAAFDNDSVFMSLEFSGKRVNGEMLMKYHNGKLYTGKLSGLVKGDTLICNYDFKIDGINKWYRNPIALLNDSGELIMGIGKIKIAWGSGIFDESIPIDYENARFIFEKTICPNH